MEIRWTPEASSNVDQIAEYVSRDRPEAALRVVSLIFAKIEQLANFPHQGREGRQAGTRELVLIPLPWIVIYRVRDSTVEILHIWHGAQDR